MGPASENAGYAVRQGQGDAADAALQWVQRPRTPVMDALEPDDMETKEASMGPASENAGYVTPSASLRLSWLGFNGSSVRERRLCFAEYALRERHDPASMGPASENAGYDGLIIGQDKGVGLQWVQRPRTPVMVPRMRDHVRSHGFNGSSVRERRLWRGGVGQAGPGRNASMGPASENAGYATELDRYLATGDASMGPASENAGYVRLCNQAYFQRLAASMGPASENAGYDPEIALKGFLNRLQWVQRPRTPVM